MEAAFFVFFSCFVVFCAGYTAPQLSQCKHDEVLSCVQDCPPETTCRTRGIQYKCLESDKKCEMKCVCKPGYYKNALGHCITGEECDQCQGPNEFFSCGTECDNKCSDLATQNRTNCPIVNVVCNRKCYCEDGFARDEKNQCVPIEKCPKSKDCDDPNEEYRDCKETCPPETCFSIIAFYDCTDEPPCKPGCACKGGYYRKHWNTTCVNSCECPQMYNAEHCEKRRNEMKKNVTEE